LDFRFWIEEGEIHETKALEPSPEFFFRQSKIQKRPRRQKSKIGGDVCYSSHIHLRWGGGMGAAAEETRADVLSWGQ
jgi:hypothetical protein